MKLIDSVKLSEGNIGIIYDILCGLIAKDKCVRIYNSLVRQADIKRVNILCGDYVYYRNSKKQCIVYDRWIYGVRNRSDRLVIDTYSAENDEDDCEVVYIGDTIRLKMSLDNENRLRQVIEIGHEGKESSRVWIVL